MLKDSQSYFIFSIVVVLTVSIYRLQCNRPDFVLETQNINFGQTIKYLSIEFPVLTEVQVTPYAYISFV